MKYSQREIVLVPFPFTDLSSIKRRPVLIISNNHYNAKHEDIVVLAITSNLFHDEYSVELNNDSLEYGVLPEKSIIKIGKVFTINKSQILKKFSIVSKETYNEVALKLNKLFSSN
jgi:mRNA interferase MazF